MDSTIATSAPGWFPRTKLVAPQIRDDIYIRAKLLDKLSHAAHTSRLTLLSAPAGSGKTTLLACLAKDEAGFRLSWVALDADDNEPGVFAQLLISSLQGIVPNLTKSVEALWSAGTVSDIHLRRVMGVIINELVEVNPDPFGLVFDDFHVIADPAILGALDYLIENMPACMHILIASRYAPALSLARLRARGHLVEFQLDELRFSYDELNEWLREGRSFELDASHVRLLIDQTEGWVAGLRLFLHSMGYAADKGEQNALFSRLERGQRHIFDFLMEEIFNKQSEDARSFLIKTSILLELTPRTCQALTGQPDAAGLLESLYRQNLFITLSQSPSREGVELDQAFSDERADKPSYRYHALFAEFLREQLNRQLPDQIQSLYERAAQAQSDPARAIHYYLAGELWEPACHTLDNLCRERVGHGYLGQLVRWVHAVPKRIRAVYLWLNLALSADMIQRGRYDEGLPLLEDTLPKSQNGQDEEAKTETLTQMSEIYTCLAQTEKAQTALQQLLIRPLSSERLVKARINQTWIHFYQGNWDKVQDELPSLLEDVQASGKTGDWFSLTLSLGPQYAFIRNGVSLLESFCLEAMTRDNDTIRAAAMAYLGYLRTLQGNWTEARRLADESRRLCDKVGGLAHLDIFINHVILFDTLHQADDECFQAYLDERLLSISSVLTRRQFLAAYLYLRALSASRQGQSGVAAEMKARLQKEKIAYELPDVATAHHLLDALAAREDGNFGEAESSLQKAVSLQETFKHQLLMTNARAGLAILYWEMDQKKNAIQTLVPLVDQAACDHLPGLLLQEGSTFVSLLHAVRNAGTQPGFLAAVLKNMDVNAASLEQPSLPKRIALGNGEYISDRELEVLRLIAEGLSNQEIAERLFISAGTAKRHSIHIYRKLGVNSRTQAIARAKEWNLL